ncbi:MAG: DUF1415 domain-containing protein [Saprospiraceae bacterium]
MERLKQEDKKRNKSMRVLDQTPIQQTKNWIHKVVIGCNFCPFAAKAMNISEGVHFDLLDPSDETPFDEYLEQQFIQLDNQSSVETSFIIFSDLGIDFESFLGIVDLANEVLILKDLEGIYQFASFHPEYCFEGVESDDPSNYTNRSIYPMLQILRETSISKVRETYPDIESIPDRNIEYARTKGLDAMLALRASCI